MTPLGFNKPLYVLPFDHRGSFQKKMFGWDGDLSAEQTDEIAAAKRVIYEAFRTPSRQECRGKKPASFVGRYQCGCNIHCSHD